MSQYNPYSPPQTYVPTMAESPVDDPAAVPNHIVEHLRGTRPWVIFLAVVGFLGAGLMVLAGLVMFALSGTAKLPAWVGLIYILFSGVCLLPAIYMVRYASSIGRLLRDPRMERLGVALDSQRVYWKAVGIMCAALIAIYPIAIAIVVAVAAAGKSF
jgi:hypothetical protein